MAAATAALIAGAAAPVVGGIAGHLMGQGDRNAANDAYNNALNSIASLQIPDVEKQKLILELPQIMGEYTPEEVVGQNLGPSKMESLQIDPAYKQNQMNALSQLAEIGQKGLTAQDMAELNKNRRDVAQNEQARQNSIIQNLAERGMGGSGNELIARLQSSQASADRASQESDRLASEAAQRKLAALQQAGQLGGQIRGQEFGEQSQVASAADTISRFNVANQNDISKLNTEARNAAQLQNLQEKQRIAEQQAALKNQEQQYNKELLQQQYQNQYNKQAAMAGQYQAQGARKADDAAATGKMWSEIGGGVGKGIAGMAGPAPGKK